MNIDKHTPMPVPAPEGVPPRPYDYYDLEMHRKIHLRDYWQILVRRKWWTLGFFLAVVLLVGLVTFLMTPVYRATTTIQLTGDNPSALVTTTPYDPMMSILGWQERQEFYHTQFQIMQSRSLARRVIDRLHLQEYPEFKVAGSGDRPIPPELAERERVDVFLSKLGVEPEKDSFLVRLSFDSADAQLAQKVANALAREYMQFGMDCRTKAYRLVQEWLDQELQKLRAKVEASERQMHKFGEQSNIMALEGQGNVILQKYTDLSGLLTKAESERMAKEAQFRQIEEKGADAPFILNNPVVVSLRQELAIQEAKVASMNQIFLADHPQMQAEQAKLRGLRSRLQSEIKRLCTSVKAEYEAAKRAEDMLRKALQSQKDQVATLQQRTVQYKILKRDVETNEQLYQGLLSRMKEASIASTIVPTNVQVIDPAELPLFPYKPKKALNLMLASVIGLFGGVGLAFLVEYLDDSIKTTEELERVSQMPVLGLVPLASTNGKAEVPSTGNEIGLMAYQQPKSGMSEAIRHLRTSILLSGAGGPPAVILVTSPNPGEGKTTLAVNLATALAVQGRRVVLIDTDLRKPQVYQIFRQPSQPGLSNLLAGNASPAQLLHATEVPDLFVVMAGTIPPSPTELLGSEKLKEYLQQLRQDFHHVILDSPPILGFADGLILSSLADGVLLVVKHQYTPREAGRLARDLLHKVQARVLGTVMNQLVTTKHGYGYYYYYQKYYKNYYAEPDSRS